MRKHEGFTPGPWKADDETVYCFDSGSNMICQIRGWGWLSKMGEEKAIEIQKANLKLIADAPTLLTENEKLKKRIAELEVLLIAALPIIHEYSLSGIQDREMRMEIGTLEQEVKRALKNDI